jgi:hypothetical protein
LPLNLDAWMRFDDPEPIYDRDAILLDGCACRGHAIKLATGRFEQRRVVWLKIKLRDVAFPVFTPLGAQPGRHFGWSFFAHFWSFPRVFIEPTFFAAGTGRAFV